MFRDIRWRIAVPYIILILTVMGLLILLLTREVRQSQLESLQENLLVSARVVANETGYLIASDRSVFLDEEAAIWSDVLEARVTLIAIDGTVLGESDEDRTQMDNHLARPEIQRAIAEGDGSSIRYSQTVDKEMMYTAVAIGEGEELAGFARVALPLDEVENSVNQLRSTIFTLALFAAGAAVILAIIIAGRITRTVNRLAETARKMAAGDLDARLYQSSQDQFGDLTYAFNHMADQLRDRVNELTRERLRLEAVLENMADGVIITDAMGRVRLINPAAQRLLAVQEEDALGRSFAEVSRHHELIEYWQESCGNQGEESAPIEVSWQGLSLRAIASPLSMEAQENCLIIIQDLTRIRRSDAVRRDFISNISHELRTPLASLKALVETVRDTALDDPPAARRFLDHAEEEVDALTQMVQELLELSRIESGVVPLRLSTTSILEVVEPPVERLRVQAERGNIKMEVDIPDDLPHVLADVGRAQQVVSNLVHNAIKFTPAGGSITVQSKLDDKAQYVNTAVTDTGVGIPTAELDRIFERFYKMDRARSSGGTGLGLAIARHLVQIHGGELWVESKEGKGSTFIFSLPVSNGQ